MIRVGDIVKNDPNPLMNVSSEYEQVVSQLAKADLPSGEVKLLACLIISQTEKQYKKYLLTVLKTLPKMPPEELISAWQQADFAINDTDFKHLLSQDEFTLVQNLDLEQHLEPYEQDYPSLFRDGLDTSFYPTKKKGILYLRRLIINYQRQYDQLDPLAKLVLHFITAQMLISWESSCIHLGLMIINNWEIEDMSRWFNKVWPIYNRL